MYLIGSATGVIVVVVPVIGGLVLLAIAVVLVVLAVIVLSKRGSGVAYISSSKNYEMSPTSSSPDIEKPKFSDVSLEPSTEKH